MSSALAETMKHPAEGLRKYPCNLLKYGAVLPNLDYGASVQEGPRLLKILRDIVAECAN